MEKYLQETTLLNYKNIKIQNLIEKNGWIDLALQKRISAVYKFVRDDVLFGYNRDDKLKASEVLEDRYGQCNTKSNLFMALLRALNIPCRLHGFVVDKEMQKGVMTGIWYKMAPHKIIHTWVEIYYKDKWLDMEGVILDLNYLEALQNRYGKREGRFYGYGVATNNFQNPQIEWNENSTYIQKEAVICELGVFDDPDSFYKVHKQDLNFFKRFLYRNMVRYIMNREVGKIRGCGD
jgi:transglutaminase-like putative cysteine protease